MSTNLLSTHADILRLVTVLDASLDGIPETERTAERKLTDRARQLDGEIVRDLGVAGISRESIGPDSLPSLVRDATAKAAEQATLEAEAREASEKIRSVREEIAGLDDSIREAKRKHDELTRRIKNLNRAILDRTIFEDAWYWLVGDGKKQELRSAEEAQSVMQERIKGLNVELESRNDRRNKLVQLADDLARKVADLEARIQENRKRQDAFRKAIAAAKENEAALGRLASLHSAQKQRAEEQGRQWNQAARDLKVRVGELRERQPRLTDLGPEGFGHAETFPEAFSFGRHVVAMDGREVKIPRLLPFPVPQALVFPPTDSGTAFLREFLLRAFQCIPPESLEVTVCDPVRLGASLNGFQGLLENRKPFPEQRFLTVAKDIEEALARLHGEIAAFQQEDCTGEIHDWTSYNAAHPGRPKLYRLLVMFDMAEQLSDTAATYLARIIENGPKCGILPLVACNPAALDARRHAALRSALTDHAVNAGRLHDGIAAFQGLRNAKITREIPDEIPDAARIETILGHLREDYAQRDRFAGAMEDLWAMEPLWGASSADGLETDIGWREDDRATPVRFAIGKHDQPVIHTLLGGKSGSGKSNLIHVLLHSLCHRYSPQELNLYLLDYKESIEFNGYANPLLPHAAGIATESDVEYGLSVLRHLEREMSRRAELFKDADVPNLYEYRRKTGLPMPRVLLVIDEFQRLFETPKEGEAAEAMLSNLLRQGRSAGIHLLLATQTLSGLRNLASARSLLSQISCRIALSCTPEDSMTLLQNDNLEASSLASPPQGIYNDDLGVKSANVKFIIPEAVAETRRRHLAELREAAESQSLAVRDCHVFDGTALPAMPPRGAFADQAAAVPGLRLLVGRTADFEENAVVADMTRKNLVVIARNEGPAGIRESVARGLGAAPGRKAFLLYTEHPEAWEALEGPDSAVARVDDEWGCEDLDEFAAGEAERKVIVLDGFENIRALRSTGYVSTRNGPSAAERLRTLVERPGKSGVQLVLCFRDYGRAQSVAKELLGVCDVRIGDASLSDPAKFAAFDAAGARDIPLPKGAKAILADRDADGPVLFRPFAVG